MNTHKANAAGLSTAVAIIISCRPASLDLGEEGAPRQANMHDDKHIMASNIILLINMNIMIDVREIGLDGVMEKIYVERVFRGKQ